MLTLERPLLWLDLESTGGNPQRDRIIQIAVIHIAGPGERKAWSTLVNPAGMAIAKEAMEKHKITPEMLTNAPTFASFAHQLAKRLSNCDFAGYNVRAFDIPLLDAEFKRCNIIVNFDSAYVVDACRLYFMKYPRTLTAFVKDMLNEDMSDEAHNAEADIDWTQRAFDAFLTRHPELPRTPKELHDLAFPRNPLAIDKLGKVVWSVGHGAAVFTFGVHADKPLQNVPDSYLDWMVNKSNFSADIKAIARQALARKYPEAPDV